MAEFDVCDVGPINAFGTTSPWRDEPENTNAYVFEGFVDFYGYRAIAEGWFIGGWIAHPWPLGHRPEKAVAVFADMPMIECSLSLFYPRDDLTGRGIGFVFFFPAAPSKTALLLSMLVETAGVPRPLYPSHGRKAVAEKELVSHLEGILTGGERGSQRQKMRTLLLGEKEDASATGLIDFYGYHDAAGGWLFSGWISRPWTEGQHPGRIVVSFDEGDIDGEAFAVVYPRGDLREDAMGIGFIVRGGLWPLGKLTSVSFEAGGVRATLYAAPDAPKLRDVDLQSRFRPLIDIAAPGPQREALSGLLARQPYRGEDTMATLSPNVLLEIDEAILSGTDGLVLMGWCLAPPNEIAAIRVRSGSRITILNLRDCMTMDRPDALEAFAQHGFTDARCGFIAFLPGAVVPGSRTYLEVETARRDVAFRNLPPARLEGIAAIKRLLSTVDVRFAEARRAFDLVLGPAVEELNRARLATKPGLEIIEYGEVPANPRFSVIVPLYGRLDFMEYQLSLFSEHPHSAEVEFVYVLDDPSRRRDAQFLFGSAYERFRIPFKAVLLDRNVGFAPANNIGLTLVRGTFVAFINSDVFPGTPDWLERLAGRMTSDPAIGVAGPVLLYEDGSVQHRGMFFTRLPEFGGWHFGMHLGKGLRPNGHHAPEAHIGITGACMLMRRELAIEMGGFDETYVVGDFEDTDLCLKLQVRGYRCIVDPDVQLYHLERKSQAGSGLGWRMNLTLYNAWQHERRWGQTIAMLRDT
jgi:GT2 family glycosyltransferase